MTYSIMQYNTNKEMEDSNDLTVASILHMCLHIYTGVLKLKESGEEFPEVVNLLVDNVLKIVTTGINGSFFVADAFIEENKNLTSIYNSFMAKDTSYYDLKDNFSVDNTINIIAILLSDPYVNEKHKDRIYSLNYKDVKTFITRLDTLCKSTELGTAS